MPLHDRAAQVLEARRRVAAHAADGAREERVAREALAAVDDEGEHPVGVAGGVQGLDAEVAALDDVAVAERRIGAAGQPRALERVGEDGHGVALAHLVEVRDVIAVVVRDEDVGHAEAVPLDRGDDRLRRPAGVDEDGAAAWAVADDVRVGEPPGLHAAFEDHGGSLASRENASVFDDPVHVRDDLRLLERLRVALRSAPRTPGEQRLHVGAGQQHRIVVPDWEALATTRPAAGVGFFGQARDGVDHDPIAVLEDEIVGRAGAIDGLLAYHNALLEPGRWANLVVFAEPAAVGGLREDAVHEDAVSRTPAHYASLRLHRGALPAGALGDAPFTLERTLFLDFAETPPRRWVRTSGSSGSRPGGA